MHNFRNWERLARELQGFHTLVVSGDDTREVGYALKTPGGPMRWDCFSET